MPARTIKARPPSGNPDAITIVHDLDRLRLHLEDAAHFSGGHADTLAIVESEAAVARVLATSSTVLPIGAQSSLTGGATPRGDVVLSTARLDRIDSIAGERVELQAGVVLAALDEALRSAGKYYPPAPTFDGAFVGGTIATNAAGAATFKYGTTRGWVEALTVVLPTGDVLDIERGAHRAHADGYFDLLLSRGAVRVPVPRYRMPDVPKISAGYFAAPQMDLVDLFIGAEGTLGVVTAATLRVVNPRPALCLAFVTCPTRAAALAFVECLRRQAVEARSHPGGSQGIDVSAIESMDERCLTLVRDDGIDRANGVTIASDAVMALLVTLELSPDLSPERAFDEIGRSRDADAPDTPLVRFCRLLFDSGLEQVEIAVPGDPRRRAQLLAVREAVPAAVNQRVARAQQAIDPRIQKVAADVIVPSANIDALLSFARQEFGRRSLDGAVWGHISDGNLHANVLPQSLDDVKSGREAIMALSREAVRLHGASLAEHGVGRNRLKQQLLRELYGESGIEDMRRVKRAIDPEWKLAPGVIFEASP